jgi:hypothetical protein
VLARDPAGFHLHEQQAEHPSHRDGVLTDDMNLMEKET